VPGWKVNPRYIKINIQFLFVYLLTAISVHGQNTAIQGKVIDSISGELLEDATVRLLKLPDHLLTTVRSKKSYSFAGLTKGGYLLISSFKGYSDDSFHFSVVIRDSPAFKHDVLMRPGSEDLLEVVVHGFIPPVVVKNDTITYNAIAYPSPQYSTVQDLLRKLPGIQVDMDGNVTMNGQKIDKITIDGNDFLFDGSRTAYQNLSADIVAQVEIFDTQSERARLTGIKENTHYKTLNIKLKKNRKRGNFGKAYAGVGTNNVYSVGGTLTRLAGPQILIASGNSNDINNQFTGTEIRNSQDAGHQLTNNLQFNYRNQWSRGIAATIISSYYDNNNSINQQLGQQTALTDSAINQYSSSTVVSRNKGYNGNLYLEYAIDSLTQLNLRSDFNSHQSNNQSSDTVSVNTQKPGNKYLSSLGRTDNESTSSGTTFKYGFDFRRILQKKGRLIYFGFYQFSFIQDQPARLYSLIRSLDSAGNILSSQIQNQKSAQTIRNNSDNFSVSYSEPIGKRHVLDFNYSLNQSSGHSDKESFDYNSQAGKFDHLDTLTTNNFLNHTTDQRFSAGYNTTEGKYRFQIGLAGQVSRLSSINLITDSVFRQRSLNWFPRASLVWELEKRKNITLDYSGSNSIPSIDQLRPIPDLTNPYLIKIGNPVLKQQFTHNLSIFYNRFNFSGTQNWQLNLNGDYSQNQIISSSTVLAGGVQELQYVNINGAFHLSSNLAYGFSAGGRKIDNASLSLQGQYGHDISIINGQQNIATNTAVGGTVNMNFRIKDSLFIDLLVNINQTLSVSSLTGLSSIQTLNENYTIDVNYRLPWSILVASYYNLQITGSQGNLPAHIVSLWNVSVHKSTLRNRGEIRLSAFDLLNKSSSFSQSIGVNYVQTRKTNLPGRLLLFCFIWRFKNFGENKS
jgi:hypothetical protein